MASKLDRSRPYGTVHGGSGVVVYEQDGKEFDGAGNQVVRAEPAQVQASGQQAGDPGAEPSPVTKDAQGNLFRDGEILDTEDHVVPTRGVVREGKLHPRESIAQGLAAAPEAFLGLLRGKNFGSSSRLPEVFTLGEPKN